MNWIALTFAGLFEVVWAIYLKNSKGFTEITPSIMFVLTLLISMGLLAYSMKSIPIGVAYPVWTGIGAIGTVIVGTVVFKEHLSLQKMFFLSLLLIGIIGLKVSSRP
ncbi:MAG: multidrug efflux SMR transporter [Bdellovibrionales bacterium]|nr:multidrug efflux SMR transporter [Bdellovibrionales bacterium]